MRSPWARLAVCTAAATLLQLDGSLVTVALPSVARGLRVSGALTSVVLGVYLSAYAILVLAAAGLFALGASGVSLRSALAVGPLIPVGLGLGLLFVPMCRAALNATPQSQHGRASAVLSVGRLSGAAAGAGLAGLAIAGGPSAATVRGALLLGCALCLVIGVPTAMRLRSRAGKWAPELAIGES